MTTSKHPRGKTYNYDFWWRGQRYTGTTGQLTKADADLVELEVKKRVRQEAYGIAPFERTHTPSFSVWAAEHYAYVAKKGKVGRLDQVQRNLRTILLFFGRRPAQEPVAKTDAVNRWKAQTARRLAAAPYHDLRLSDPITNPEWIERFEDWMRSEGMSGSRKNQLRSTASGLYRTALLPAFRKQANVASNPFLNLGRDDVFSRERTLTQRQLYAWIAAAAPHIRVALAIAAYAPKLRLGVILGLQWSEHFDADVTRIIVERHKARAKKRRPQVVLLTEDLRAILLARRKARPRDRFVITYKGREVTSLKTGLASAARRANESLPPEEHIAYGIASGFTFHSVRHTVATMLAEMGVGEKLREAVMDQTQDTIRGYTHLVPVHEKRPMQKLAKRLQLVGAVNAPVLGPVPGPAVGTESKPEQNREGGSGGSKGRKRA